MVAFSFKHEASFRGVAFDVVPDYMRVAQVVEPIRVQGRSTSRCSRSEKGYSLPRHHSHLSR